MKFNKIVAVTLISLALVIPTLLFVPREITYDIVKNTSIKRWINDFDKDSTNNVLKQIKPNNYNSVEASNAPSLELVNLYSYHQSFNRDWYSKKLRWWN